ncbi:MAG TPA: hypothetical protein VIU11_02460 [Nakamurella sp.]
MADPVAPGELPILWGMAPDPHMVFLGFGKYARADKIFALEPIRGEDRGDGRRTQVWVEGIGGPIVASRTERTILGDMGQERAAEPAILEEALELAEHLARAAEVGRVDLGDLGRRARHLLESATAAGAVRADDHADQPRLL